MRIKHLMLYPVKSAAGIDVSTAMLTQEGLVSGNHKDHQYILVKSEPNEGIHDVVTQRDKRSKEDLRQGLSALALIKPRLIDDVLELTWQHHDPIAVEPRKGKELSVRVWGHQSYAVDQGNQLAEWLSDHLNYAVRLVKAEGRFTRMTNQNYLKNSNPLSFQDGYPIHWFSIESVDELSQIIGEPFPWQSFRPQIVMEGMPAQYEHQIYEGSIAGIPFIDPKPCDRCPVTLVDQETAEVRTKEPLKSLSTYKKWRNNRGDIKVIFGENMLPMDQGMISFGDEMKVSSIRDPPLIYGKGV